LLLCVFVKERKDNPDQPHNAQDDTRQEDAVRVRRYVLRLNLGVLDAKGVPVQLFL